jgi:hypothetical protein
MLIFRVAENQLIHPFIVRSQILRFHTLIITEKLEFMNQAGNFIKHKMSHKWKALTQGTAKLGPVSNSWNSIKNNSLKKSLPLNDSSHKRD